jgi:hypothetical protein
MSAQPRLRAAVALVLVAISATEVSAQRVVEARVELLQTGEPASVHNPDCADGAAPMTAADLVLKVGAAAVDAYIGYPVVTPLLEKADSGQVNWLKVRMGLHNGKAHCATQCIIVPAASFKDSKDEVCMSETGGDGLECHSGNADYPWGWMGNFSYTRTSNSGVICAYAKNWSHNRNRWFILRSTY